MEISDLLTLIGILLAIGTFISEKNREYVFLKFSRFQFFLLAGIFAFLHFLISYDWLREKNIFISCFEIACCPTPSAWAYIISLTTLFWAVWRIFKGKFPIANRERLMKYYEKLLMQNDIAFLSELIEKYHLENVLSFLREKKTTDTHSNSRIYGENVYSRIIINEKFIDNAANLNPNLFARIIKELNTKNVQDDDFVNRFLKIITLNKNGNFFREIRANQNLDELNDYRIEEKRPILYSLFNNIEVATINQAWRGIGEQALLEMAEEVKKEYSSLREFNIVAQDDDDDTIWDFRITIAIWYFDIMVRRAITQNGNYHMWMHYYVYFVEAILNNMKELAPSELTQNRKTRNFKLIEHIFYKMTDWKNIIDNSQKKNYLLLLLIALKSVRKC